MRSWKDDKRWPVATDLILLALALLLIAGNALFVAAEFSLVALDPATIDDRAQAGDSKSQRVRKALHNLSLQLSSCQVGITITTILLGYVATIPLQHFFSGVLTNQGVAQAAAVGTAATLAFIITNIASMLFGELIPKNMALAEPLATAAFVSWPLRAFTTLFKPIIVILNGTANWILRKFGIEPAEELSGARSASELSALVRHSAQEGTLDLPTARLLTRSIDIGTLTAVDVMTDRGRMATIHEDDTAADVITLAAATGHSRFPVIGEDLDDIRGFVHLRRAVAVPYEARSQVRVTSSSLLVEPTRVPETIELAPLLVQLRAEGLQMAVVVDEYGGTSGIVTLEDAVEEIVGDVADEHDRRRVRTHIVSGGDWMIPGSMRPDEVARELGLDVPDEGPWETVGGWMMARLGRMPKVGDAVEDGGVRAVVATMDGRRIEQVRISGVEE
ncbi:hemolysin family protein [Trueperella pyogenes]|uniref:hemolysin family protein n=1 Tax=Trueperella pyogenes TaxID=1661 RepID=UPI00324DDF14